jgi:hypothetical protein
MAEPQMPCTMFPGHWIPTPGTKKAPLRPERGFFMVTASADRSSWPSPMQHRLIRMRRVMLGTHDHLFAALTVGTD